MNNNNENISLTKQEPCPDNNMALAIASTIATFFGCFIFGSIFGVMAIVYASKVSSYWNGGFHDEAKRYASKAKKREYEKAIKFITDPNYILHFKMIFKKEK